MKKTIALVTGGFTGESVISLQSAEVIERNIDPERFDVYKIIITRESWYYVDNNAVKHVVDRNDFSLQLKDKAVRFDGVFIGLHGSPGEDGKLQGYFDMLGIPYTSCDALTSAITMNKGYTKAVVNGIPDLHLAPSVQLFENREDAPDEILAKLQLPVFVKPNNGGSSVAMSKVKTAEELPEALEKAFKEDNQVLVEQFVSGREFTIGVYKGREGIQVLPATEIISSKEFFDFEAKYTAGMTQEITPARMTEEELARVHTIVVNAYKKLNCRGVVRIDYFLEHNTGNFYFIEVNTVPGQTEGSLIPQQVRAAGKTISDFYTELLETALGK
ncbi:D-alanine--D-alanine ligase [Arcticibacter sp. MXS-1]|uniref:D-alanine--D-alanine ligase n=1 Tax=Arcticibacter sp. MXS-1 TaxID=3341726 RepID=UPI0035A8B43C